MEKERDFPAKKIVLVVEDEPLLLMMAGDIVEDADLEPILAHNADEAILVLELRNDVSIVFTDVRMRGRWMASGLQPPFGTDGHQ
jgi:two-component system, response regulator PdtaR